MSYVVIGVDPDSKHLTATATRGKHYWQVHRKVLPDAKAPEKLDSAWRWMFRLVKSYCDQGFDVHVFIESPFYSPKTARALIPLARLNGCLLAASHRAGAVTVHETHIQTWKKDAIGSGGASKPQIEAWCKKYWLNLWTYGQQFTKAAGRQDVYDSAGINRYGKILIERTKTHSKINNAKD